MLIDEEGCDEHMRAVAVAKFGNFSVKVKNLGPARQPRISIRRYLLGDNEETFLMRSMFLTMFIVLAGSLVQAQKVEDAPNLYRTVDPLELSARIVPPSRSEFLDSRPIVFDAEVVDNVIWRTTSANAAVSNAPEASSASSDLPALRLQLSSDAEPLEFRTGAIKLHTNGTASWRGTTAHGTGSAKLTFGENGECWGRIKDSGEIYVIRPVGDGVHYISRLDMNYLEARMSPGYDNNRSGEEWLQERERAKRKKAELNNELQQRTP